MLLAASPLPPLHRPLPARERRDLQLKHHLALARLHDACREPAPLALLANVARLALALRGTAGVADPRALCRDAEAALEATYLRGAPYRLDAAARATLERLLAVHDAQLEAVTAGRYLDAWRTVRTRNAEPARRAMKTISMPDSPRKSPDFAIRPLV